MSWTTEWVELSPSRGKIFLLSTSLRLVLGPTQPPVQWVPQPLSWGGGGKWPEHDANHSPPNKCQGQEYLDLYIHSPICLHGIVLN
jgi:hypothetical protein